MVTVTTNTFYASNKLIYIFEYSFVCHIQNDIHIKTQCAITHECNQIITHIISCMYRIKRPCLIEKIHVQICNNIIIKHIIFDGTSTTIGNLYYFSHNPCIMLVNTTSLLITLLLCYYTSSTEPNRAYH